jgi:2,3-bisphosphoglycerate-independent phosphoglycerate mutase
MQGPLALVILDGFGYREEQTYNAIALAQKPIFNFLLENYPWTLLDASGEAVGLLPGMIGNSEVGHMTLGAGRIIEQPVVVLNKTIDDGSFFTNPILKNNLEHLSISGHALHILGLLSDAGVHSDIKHIEAYLDAAVRYGVKKIYIHAFLDGRDVVPTSAGMYLERLEKKCSSLHAGVISSITGRYFAMDRDKNFDRTDRALSVLLHQKSSKWDSWSQVLDYYYARGVTDEFIPPAQLHSEGVIRNGDGLICANFRPDRIRQLASSINKSGISLAFFITPVDYGLGSQTTPLLIFDTIKNTLKEVLSQQALSIFTIAETEKYAHVTYFFGGRKEDPFEGEARVLIPSLHHKTYTHNPRMSADAITKTIISSLKNNKYDFYLINYANADMVGHSGNLAATIKAIECLDQQLEVLYKEIVLKRSGTLIITGDHGKAELMYDIKTKQPCTAHTTNQVYCIVASLDSNSAIPSTVKGLADVAPLILQIMNIHTIDI